MRKIKIKLVDFWKGFEYTEHMIFQVLQKYYEIEFSEEPEYLIYSVFGNEHLNYDCVKLFWTGENIVPDFNFCDYAIGFEYLEYGDRYYRCPNYFSGYYKKIRKRMQEKHLLPIEIQNKKFCSFVYSNGQADAMRDIIFDALSQYKKVDSGGKYRNNITSNGVADKLIFESDYKFSIACENSSHSGYTTEKIIGAFAAGGIPIYWGDPDIKKVFNEKAFICVNDFKTKDELVDVVKEIDNDDELYSKICQEPALVDAQYERKVFRGLEEFLRNIFDMPYKQCIRRGTTMWAKAYLENMREMKFAMEHPLKMYVQKKWKS